MFALFWYNKKFLSSPYSSDKEKYLCHEQINSPNAAFLKNLFDGNSYKISKLPSINGSLFNKL